MENESDFNHLNHKLNQIDLETYEAVFPAPLVQSQLPMHWISTFFYVVQVIKCLSVPACNHELYRMSEARRLRLPELPQQTGKLWQLGHGNFHHDCVGTWCKKEVGNDGNVNFKEIQGVQVWLVRLSKRWHTFQASFLFTLFLYKCQCCKAKKQQLDGKAWEWVGLSPPGHEL